MKLVKWWWFYFLFKVHKVFTGQHFLFLFLHFVVLQPYSIIDSMHFFYFKILHIIPHNDKVNKVWKFCRFSKNKKLNYNMFISIHSIWHDSQNWAQVHSVSTHHFHISMVNSGDWTWFGKTYSCICTVYSLSANQVIKSKHLSVDLWDWYWVINAKKGVKRKYWENIKYFLRFILKFISNEFAKM